MMLPTTVKSLLSLLAAACILHVAGCSSSPKSIPSGPSGTDAYKAGRVVSLARSMVGTPYKYGGLHPKTGFDCSGLVYYTHQSVGYALPRTSYGQFKSTSPVGRQHLHAGDLVFFRVRRNRISHVGIYLGDDLFVHAPSSGKEVRINSLDEPYWDKRFVRGGRVF